MMNYLILDTEKTYNYGYIIMNEKGEVLKRNNIVVKNNFENRKIIGEVTYKNKKAIYDNDPECLYLAAANTATFFKELIQKFDIKYAIAHNANEDRRQLEALALQTGVAIPNIEFYDSIKLVKTLFPNNSQTGLQSIIEDVSGKKVTQTHTALQDCDLLLSFLQPIAKELKYFISYQEIFAKDNDYEITKKLYMNLKDIPKMPFNIKELHEVLGITETGDKRKIKNLLNKQSELYNFWKVRECVEYSDKTGKALKTPGCEIFADNTTLFEEALAISEVFLKLDNLATKIVDSCSQLAEYDNIKTVVKIDNDAIAKLEAEKMKLQKENEELKLKLQQCERELEISLCNAIDTDNAIKNFAKEFATEIKKELKPVEVKTEKKKDGFFGTFGKIIFGLIIGALLMA